MVSFLYEFRCIGIQSLYFYKWLQTLNWSKRILVVHVPNQSLFTHYCCSLIALFGIYWEFTSILILKKNYPQIVISCKIGKWHNVVLPANTLLSYTGFYPREDSYRLLVYVHMPAFWGAFSGIGILIGEFSLRT